MEQFDENVDLLLDVPTASNMVALMTTPVEMETDRTRDDGARDANVPDEQSSALLQKEVETGTISIFKLSYLYTVSKVSNLLLQIYIYSWIFRSPLMICN